MKALKEENVKIRRFENTDKTKVFEMIVFASSEEIFINTWEWYKKHRTTLNFDEEFWSGLINLLKLNMYPFEQFAKVLSDYMFEKSSLKTSVPDAKEVVEILMEEKTNIASAVIALMNNYKK